MASDVETTTFEEIVDAISDALADLDCDVAMMRLAIPENAKDRRVIFIPTGGALDSPEHTGPHVNVADDYDTLDVIYSAHVDVECHIRGVDFRDTWNTHTRVLNAVHEALGAQCEPGSFTWQTQAEGTAAHMLGAHELIVQNFVWKLNVPRVEAEPGSSTRIKTVQTTPTSDQTTESDITITFPDAT